MKSARHRCPGCRSVKIRRSTRKTVTEKLLSLARKGSETREALDLGSVARDVAAMTRGLKNYRDLRHIAAELADRIAVDAVPRKGSRGNALLWVLHQFRRRQGLSLDDLEYAFKRMGVFTSDDPEARRKVAWELGELGRKGWPIKSDGSLHRLELPGGRS